MDWHNEPPRWAVDGDTITIRSGPKTDFWRTTHYGFIRDSGHFYHDRIAGDFLVEVKVKGKTTMHKTTILFGYPKDSTEFDRHYHEIHLPLTSKLKGIRGLTIGKLEAGDNGDKAPYYLMTAIYTDSREALNATLTTPEGQAVLKDVPNFATGGFTLLHDDEEVLIPLTLL